MKRKNSRTINSIKDLIMKRKNSRTIIGIIITLLVGIGIHLVSASFHIIITLLVGIGIFNIDLIIKAFHYSLNLVENTGIINIIAHYFSGNPQNVISSNGEAQ